MLRDDVRRVGFRTYRKKVLKNPQISPFLVVLWNCAFHNHRILHKNLFLKAYKVQLPQEFKPANHQQRSVFAIWVLEMHENE